MFEICRKCGKVIEDVDAKRTYEIYDIRKGLRKCRMLRCSVHCPICNQTDVREYVVKKKSKHDFYLTRGYAYRIIHSDVPEEIDKELEENNKKLFADIELGNVELTKMEERSENGTKKITVIDGVSVIITDCWGCPFYDRGDDGYGSQCKYPGHDIEPGENPFEMNSNCPLKDYESE